MEICTSDTDYFRSIDGNWISKPVGYCTYHRGYVSERQAKVHKCHRKHGGTCGRLANMEGRLIKRMNQQQYYDKSIDRMDKMCESLKRISRSLEAISKSIDTKNEYPVYTVTGALKSIDMTHLEAKDSSDQYGNVTINE